MFRERTRLGPQRITLDDIFRLVAGLRAAQKHVSSETRNQRSAEINRLLSLRVTDVGWRR